MLRTLARVARLAFVPVAAGCASAPPPAMDPPTPAPPASASASPTAPHTPPEPILVPMEGAAAPWRESARGGTPPAHPLAMAHVVAAGKKFGIVRAQAGFFSVHETRGVEGPIAVPDETVWVGIDGDDGVYAASRSGALTRADSLEAALGGKGWKPRATIPSVTGWDATVGLVVAASPAGVHVSTDRGATFRATLPSGFAPHFVLARPDGVLVASAKDEALPPQISTDRGKTWQPSKLPAARLRRAGGWIEAMLPCPAALAKDATWVVGSPPVELSGHAWEHATSVTPLAEAWVRSPRVTAIAPPPPDAKKSSPAPTSCEPPASTGKVRTGQSVAEGPRCEHADCLRGATEGPPDPTRAEAALLGGATCDKGNPGDRCAPDAPHTSEPSIAFVDVVAKTMKVTKAPAGCRPHGVFSAGGLAVLACADAARTKLFSSDATASLREEGALPIAAADVGSLAIATDGTILLRAAWDREGQRRAFVRAPVAAGTATAWREIALADVIELRVAPAGQTLVFGATAGGGMSIAIDSAAGRRPLVADVPLTGHVVDASIVEGRVVLWMLKQMHRGRVAPGTPAARGGAEPFYVGKDGTLEPYPAAQPQLAQRGQ